MDLCITHLSNNAYSDCPQDAQSVTMWDRLLCVMGGALVPKECFWYFLDFKSQIAQPQDETVCDCVGRAFMCDRRFPKECFWYLLGFKWSSRMWKYQNVKTTGSCQGMQCSRLEYFDTMVGATRGGTLWVYI